jgi:hypothetical protein
MTGQSIMDKQFLEFWGNYLLAVARGQQQMEDLKRWMEQGFGGVQKLNDMFKAAYNLPAEENKAAPDDPEIWAKTADAFNASLKEYMNQMGWVPRQDHDNLVKENEALTQKLTLLEKSLQRLEDLIDEKHPGQARTVRALEDLVEKQTTDFNRLMQSLAKAMEKTTTETPSSEKQPPQK